MLHHTEGIVLGSLKYKESSLIVKIFTNAFGMQSYVVNGVRSSKSQGKTALYQPLTLLDMVVYHKPQRDLHRISEAKLKYAYQQIPFDPLKRAIALFLTEVFGKVLREESENTGLFYFLKNGFIQLDGQTGHISNFHLQVLLQATLLLGFGPADGSDLLHQLQESGVHFSVLPNEHEALDRLMAEPLGATIPVKYTFKKDLLEHILKFYQIHTDTLREIKSLEILKNIS